ncbi:MAG: hypothetical protein JKY57_05595 [Kordiimonadaceae bacterium]|nr:hypothetical protein [Kordiimonadaceae bacterium]
MRKTHLGYICATALLLGGGGTLAKDVDLAKEAANMQQVSFIMTNYGPGRATRKEMRSAEKKVERTWADFVEIQGENHALTRPLSLIRARTLTAAKRTKKIVPAWQGALRRLPARATAGRRVNLYIEAANAAASVGKFREAQAFYAVARSLEVLKSKNKEKSQLYFRLHELKSVSVGMQWRPLRDALSDLRKSSEHFVLWSVPRVDALLGEAEIRVAHQPNHKEKRADLGELKAQLILAEKGMNTGMPAAQLKRMRELFYVLEDYWRL